MESTTNDSPRAAPVRCMTHPQELPQPPPPPPLDPPKGLSAKIRKIKSRFSHHPTPKVPNAKEQSTEEGSTVPPGTWDVKVDEVLKVVLLHKGFSSPVLNIIAGDQPEFDSLEAYNVSDEQATTLWTSEVRRLIDVVNRKDAILRFYGGDLGESSKEGYSKLSSMAKRISESSMIYEHDNEVLTLVHYKDLHRELAYRKAQRTLNYLDSEAKSNTTEEEAPGNEYLTALFALVDYITAMIAKLFAQSAYGKSWMNHCLATLARWATKVKVVSRNLPSSARLSLDLAAGTIPYDSTESSAGSMPKDRIANNLPTTLTGGLETDAEEGKSLYFVHQALFRATILKMVNYVLLSLRHGSHSERPITSYDICSVVYETGFVEGFKTLLFQDRDGEFLASSDLGCLNLAHSAFSILHQTTQEVQNSRAASHPPGPSLNTKIRWSYHEDSGESPAANRSERTIILTKMEDVVTLMVPLMLTSPMLVSDIKDFIRMAALASKLILDDIYLYEGSNFKAFFHIFTTEFEEAEKKHMNVSSLSDGLMNRDKLLSGPKIAEIVPPGATTRDMSTSPNGNGAAATGTQTTQASNAAKIKEADRIMNEWIFDERAVTVKCEPYVWMVTIVATILVLGGLTIGFVVQNRITGVDPFNITMYCWVLAAFVILVCKSLLVQDWPWREFLLRRVQCRSVSELQAVTGINAQLILAKLLHDERTTTLVTRGPFNAVFSRKSEDGFSIDVPLSMWTMLLSGLIILKVASLEGPALACLDARRGTKYACILHDNTYRLDGKEGEFLVCAEFSRLSTGESGSSQGKFPLNKSSLGWKKALGLYNNRYAEFI